MKKILVVLLALTVAATLFAGCGGSSAPSSADAGAAPAAAEASAPAAAESSAPAAAESSAPAAEASSESAAPEAPAEDVDFGEPISLLMGHGFPEEGNTKTAVWRDLSAKANELSGGTITIDQAYSGSIVGDDGILDAVLNGILTLGPLPDSYATGYIPELAPLCIPGWFSGTSEEYVQFEADIFDVMTRIFEKYGLKYISGDYPGQSAFFGNGDPLLTPEDTVGKLVRVSGTDQINAVETWGGAGTIIPLPDLTTALDRGTVDCAMSGYQLIHVFSFDEVCDWAVILPTYEPAHCFFMTMDTWNSMSPAQQDAMMEAWADITPITFQASLEQEYEPYLAEFREAGMDVYEMTPEEFEAFSDLLKPNFDALKEGNTEEGLELMKILYQYHGWEWED